MATMNPNKAAKMAGQAFDNGLRLHLDSIIMYKSGSVPTSLQLSILAQEEIGKAFLLEEHAYHEWIHRGEASDGEEAQYNSWLVDDLFSHRRKQRWFSRRADDEYYYGKKRFPRIVREALEHKLDLRKQLATYVGLTWKNGKPDLHGKITVPMKRISAKEASEHITRVNDFLIELCEGVAREVYGVDTDELEERLNQTLVKTLEKTWTAKSSRSTVKLKKLRAIPIDS